MSFQTSPIILQTQHNQFPFYSHKLYYKLLIPMDTVIYINYTKNHKQFHSDHHFLLNTKGICKNRIQFLLFLNNHLLGHQYQLYLVISIFHIGLYIKQVLVDHVSLVQNTLVQKYSMLLLICSN